MTATMTATGDTDLPDNIDPHAVAWFKRELDHYKREVDHYKRDCNEIGARLHRAQEEQTRAMREARRAWATAKLVREAVALADFGGPEADIDRAFLGLMLDNALCDCAMLLRQEGSRFGVLSALGAGAVGGRAGEIVLRRPPRFLHTSGDMDVDEVPASELIALIGVPFILWGHDPGSGVAVLLGNRRESNASRPFEPADEQLVHTALTIYLLAAYRKEELRRHHALPASGGEAAHAAPDAGAPGIAGIQECEIQEGLREGGRVTGFLVVDRTNGATPEFVGYLRGSWTKDYRILRTFRDRGDRTYRDLSRLVHLARFEFGFESPVVVYAAGAPELKRFPGVRARDLAPFSERSSPDAGANGRARASDAGLV